MRGSPVVSHTSRIPRFGARCWLRWVRRSDLGWSPLPPSFLSSSPAKNRAGGDWPSRKQAQGVGAARSLRRGHGPARLDGQAPAATVAGSAMKEWKDGFPANGQGSDEPTAARRAPRVPRARLAEGDQARSEHRQHGLVDQAPPGRRYRGAPSLRGGDWLSQSPGGDRLVLVARSSPRGTAKGTARPPPCYPMLFGKRSAQPATLAEASGIKAEWP